MIVPALMNVVTALSDTLGTELINDTHTPLVLDSVEPLFDPEKDKLFHLNLEQGLVKLEHVPFFKRGPINEWLVSDIFGLTEPRSREAEQAIEDAKEIQLPKEPLREKVQEISDRLIKVLAADDEF